MLLVLQFLFNVASTPLSPSLSSASFSVHAPCAPLWGVFWPIFVHGCIFLHSTYSCAVTCACLCYMQIVSPLKAELIVPNIDLVVVFQRGHSRENCSQIL